jgi:sugar lactone lactonase YvrE
MRVTDREAGGDYRAGIHALFTTRTERSLSVVSLMAVLCLMFVSSASAEALAFVRSVGSKGEGSGQFKGPQGVATDSEGNIWVIDRGNDRAQEFDASGKFIRMIGGKVDKTTGSNVCSAVTGDKCGAGEAGSAAGWFSEPNYIAVGPHNEVWISDQQNNRIQEFNSSGVWVRTVGNQREEYYDGCGLPAMAEQMKEGELCAPTGLAVDAPGNVWVADENAFASRVQEFSPEGKLISHLPPLGRGPTAGMAIDSSGNIWLAEEFTLSKYDPHGELLWQVSDPGETEEEEMFLLDVAVDSEGNGWIGGLGDFYTFYNAGYDYAGMPKYSASGALTSTSDVFQYRIGPAPLGKFLQPWGVAIDPAGDLWVSDYPEDRIQEFRKKVPLVETASASEIGTSSATLNGTVDPEGNATSYWFEYGPTTAYGTKVPVSPKEVGSGTSDIALSQAVSGLTSGTTYHYRIVAMSEAGTARGTDMTVTPVVNMNDALNALPVRDSFLVNEEHLSFGGSFAALAWDSSASGHDTGFVLGGWRPYDPYPVVAGAYWQNSNFESGSGGDAVAAFLYSGPGNNFPGRYVSEWLNAPNPGSTQSGYQLRFVETALNTYEVTLAKWVSGVEDVLASKTGYAFADKSRFAIVDKGGVVSAWTDSGSGYSELLSAKDSTYPSGYIGIDGSGTGTRLREFSGGELAPF